MINAEVIDKRIFTVERTGKTIYFVTFKFDSNTITELEVSPRDYNMIYEKQSGELTYQGPKFIKFIKFDKFINEACH